jgi:ribonuclease Z
VNRQLTVLGTASQAPTRHRNHNGYLVRWDDRLVLFDPGEGTQRQFTFAGVAAARVTDICITHFHGDHCLGLPGIIQRLNGDRVEREVSIYHPADGAEYFERLRYASVYGESTPLRPVPLDADGVAGELGTHTTLSVAALDHRITTYGYRIEEAERLRFVPERLEELGIQGPQVGQLRRLGELTVKGRTVGIDEVSETRPGQSMALVMDTRMCDAAVALARNADTLICESTYLESEAKLAHDYGHLTAAQAATIARDAGVGELVLTHFSARYDDVSKFVDEAGAIFENVRTVEDFDRVPLVRRGD